MTMRTGAACGIARQWIFAEEMNEKMDYHKLFSFFLSVILSKCCEVEIGNFYVLLSYLPLISLSGLIVTWAMVSGYPTNGTTNNPSEGKCNRLLLRHFQETGLQQKIQKDQQKKIKQKQKQKHHQSIQTVHWKEFFKPWKEVSPELYYKSSQLQRYDLYPAYFIYLTS